MAGYVTIGGILSSLTSGTTYVGPYPVPGNSSNQLVISEFSGAGPFTFTIASWCRIGIFVPPPTNTIGITLKGASGDTGIQIDPANPTMLTFPASSGTTVIILPASSISTNMTFIFA